MPINIESNDMNSDKEIHTLEKELETSVKIKNEMINQISSYLPKKLTYDIKSSAKAKKDLEEKIKDANKTAEEKIVDAFVKSENDKLLRQKAGRKILCKSKFRTNKE